MLRKAIKRNTQEAVVKPGKHRKSPKRLKQVVGDSQTVLDDDDDDVTRGLEEAVFTGGDVVTELKNDSKREIKEAQENDTESQPKIAWEDEYEKDKSGNKQQQTPAWAKIKTAEKKEDEDITSLLRKTGDVLVGSTVLPKGILQVKKLVDANHEDDTEGRITNIEFHPSAKVVMASAAGSPRASLFQVDGQNNSKIQTIFFEDYPIQTAHFSNNGEEIVVGSPRKNFYSYDMLAGRINNVPRIKALDGCNMARFEISPDGRFLVFLGRFGSMHLISAKTKEWITTLKMNGDVSSVSFKRDGSKMFSYGSSGTVFVWDMNSRSCVHTFEDEGCVQGTTISSSPNNQFIACGSQSGIVNIYSQDTCLKERSPKPLKSLKNLTTVCSRTKFNVTSEILGISSNETKKALRLVHFPSLHAFANFPGQTDTHLQIPYSFDFSPNGGYLSIGTQKGRALLYRLGHYGSY